jgi:hypothetical protein
LVKVDAGEGAPALQLSLAKITVPFTLAHAAAALPSRRLRLIPSAVIIGTFAPDFEYFLRFAPDRGFGHTWRGILELSFPLAILVLWIFHTFVKVPVIGLLPDGLRRRLVGQAFGFEFCGAGRLLLIAASILLGIGTHVVWDSFTHPYYWPYRHWSLLRETLRVPVLGTIPYYKLFQHGSTVLGLAILLVWCFTGIEIPSLLGIWSDCRLAKNELPSCW